MKKVEIICSVLEFHSIKELDLKDKLLVGKAKNAIKSAYSPYSKFQVGAAVLLKNGEIITGSNQENAAYPSGLCAERVALFYANSKFPEVPVSAIAICNFSAFKEIEKPISPCGACRQVLLETEIRFQNPIKVILVGQNKIQVINEVKQLLPLSFDSEFLL
ncbi:MAG: cytidine deaminase [Bacteroidetes bacterium]|jgi:cytidine deaminase|nr:cytidine deaminase [Bacteroidota bacterium]MBT6686022.1 cytidine deaminase [Bacteroidota bacterium]